MSRIVALGASNLTRGFATIVAAARARWGPDVEVIAALGHGRSYGSASRVIVRTLPSILDCDLWSRLDSCPPAPTRALVTDIGNDILYGAPAPQILSWIDELLRRLRRVTDDVVLLGLPMQNVRSLSRRKFLFFRTLFFPGHHLAFDQVRDTAEAVSAGLVDLARTHEARLLAPRDEWYGIDPIHIRPSAWGPAWREILGVSPAASPRPPSRREAVRLYLAPPQRRWWCGVEQVTPQSGLTLPAGGRIWLY